MAYSVKSRYIALGKESVRGTENTAPTVYIPITDDTELDYKLLHVNDELSRGIFADFPPNAGRFEGTGRIGGDFESTLCGDFLNALLGTDTQTEQAITTVTDNNKYLGFDIGAGELVATVAAGTYAIGTAHTQAGTLCKAIYDAIVAAEAVGTYTVSYSRTTRKFTITRSAGTLSILWKTGTHGADGTDKHIGTLIGYSDAADDTGALTYAADNQIDFAITHAFTRGTGIQMPSYTIHSARGISQKAYTLACVKSLQLEIPVDGAVRYVAEILFKAEGTSNATLAPSWADPDPLMFNQAVVSINNTPDTTQVRSLQLTIDNQAVAHKLLNGSQQVADILAIGKLLIQGSGVIIFESETERAKFLANTSIDLDIDITGTVIAGSVANKLSIAIPRTHYTAYPYGNQEGFLGAAITFNGFYDPTTSKAIQIELTNKNIADY
jgi:hypothetical protein